jgi:hypothetical protein
MRENKKLIITVKVVIIRFALMQIYANFSFKSKLERNSFVLWLLVEYLLLLNLSIYFLLLNCIVGMWQQFAIASRSGLNSNNSVKLAVQNPAVEWNITAELFVCCSAKPFYLYSLL